MNFDIEVYQAPDTPPIGAGRQQVWRWRPVLRVGKTSLPLGESTENHTTAGAARTAGEKHLIAFVRDGLIGGANFTRLANAQAETQRPSGLVIAR